MSASEYRIGRILRARRFGTRWAALAVSGSAVVGALAAVSIRGAVALTVAAALFVAVLQAPANLLIVLFSSIFAETISLGGVTVSRLIAPVAVLAVLGALSAGGAIVRFSSPLGWSAAYVLWALASALWSVDAGGTAFALASLAIAAAFMIAFAVLLSTENELRRVLFWACMAASAAAIVGIIAYVFGVFSTFAGRAEGVTGDPNLFAAYEIAMLPIAVVLLGEPLQGWRRAALAGTLVTITAAVFVSLSRGGLLTLGITVALLLLAPARSLFQSRRLKVAVLVVVALASVGAFRAASSQLTARLNAVSSWDKGGSGRVNEWRAALTAIREHPVLGLGYGGFLSSSNELLLRTPGVDLASFELRQRGVAAHNVYLGSAADLGIPGACFFVGMLVSSGMALRRVARRAATAGEAFVARSAAALLVGLTSLGFASLFLSTETSRALWIIVGLAVALPRVLDTKSELT